MDSVRSVTLFPPLNLSVSGDVTPLSVRLPLPSVPWLFVSFHVVLFTLLPLSVLLHCVVLVPPSHVEVHRSGLPERVFLRKLVSGLLLFPLISVSLVNLVCPCWTTCTFPVFSDSHPELTSVAPGFSVLCWKSLKLRIRFSSLFDNFLKFVPFVWGSKNLLRRPTMYLELVLPGSHPRLPDGTPRWRYRVQFPYHRLLCLSSTRRSFI